MKTYIDVCTYIHVDICIGTDNFWWGTPDPIIITSREWDCWRFY